MFSHDPSKYCTSDAVFLQLDTHTHTHTHTHAHTHAHTDTTLMHTYIENLRALPMRLLVKKVKTKLLAFS